jgi:hypothetical protein
LLSESGGYASDGDKSGQDVGWKRKWGMGALIDMLKPKEAEPVYLIKPVRTPWMFYLSTTVVVVREVSSLAACDWAMAGRFGLFVGLSRR